MRKCASEFYRVLSAVDLMMNRIVSQGAQAILQMSHFNLMVYTCIYISFDN